VQAHSYLDVVVALPSSPPAKDGLFEVSTPIGLAELRIDTVGDSLLEALPVLPNDASRECTKDIENALLMRLPAEWFEPALLRRAWASKSVDLCKEEDAEPNVSGYADESDGKGEGHSGAAWWSWLEQWGEVHQLTLSMHAGEEDANGTVLLAVSFVSTAALACCHQALGGERLMVLQDPPRAAFPRSRCAALSEFEEMAEAAWQEHLNFEQEVNRIDQTAVLQEAADAVPRGAEACYAPLLELLAVWAKHGSLRATSTICSQRHLLEEEAIASRPSPDVFRRACWHGALRLLVQIRPCKDEADALALAVCEHWRKVHGICLDLDHEELFEFAEVLEEVWLRCRHEEELWHCAAEAEARSAEKDLLETLDAEEGQQARDRKRKDKKRQKERQKRRERGASKPSDDVGKECGEDGSSQTETIPEHAVCACASKSSDDLGREGANFRSLDAETIPEHAISCIFESIATCSEACDPVGAVR
jgi:hypothetical protein